MVASIASSTLSLLLLIFYSYFADCLFPKSLLMILIFLMALATSILSSSIICCSPKMHFHKVDLSAHGSTSSAVSGGFTKEEYSPSAPYYSVDLDLA